MFSKFLGKNDKAVDPPPKDGLDSRGLEVIEDDPETVWSMWDEALAAQDSRFGAPEPTAATPLPTVDTEQATVPMALDQVEEPTQPLALEERTVEQRQNDALEVVELHHHRIANTIRTLWGHKECSMYINKLIMNGGDGMGHARIGFNQDAAAAMMALSDLHEKQFGVLDEGAGLGFNAQSGFAGLDKFR